MRGSKWDHVRKPVEHEREGGEGGVRARVGRTRGAGGERRRRTCSNTRRRRATRKQYPRRRATHTQRSGLVGRIWLTLCVAATGMWMLCVTNRSISHPQQQRQGRQATTITTTPIPSYTQPPPRHHQRRPPHATAATEPNMTRAHKRAEGRARLTHFMHQPLARRGCPRGRPLLAQPRRLHGR